MSTYARRAQAFPSLDLRPTRAFRANLPALDLFPTSLWAQIASRRARGARMSHLLGTGPMGYAPLQAAVAEYLRVSRGVTCEPEQVAIVSGVQEALDLAARLVVDPGDQVWMEDPGYIGAARVFESIGANVTWQPVDDEGMVLPSVRQRPARLVYVTPAHQMPLGVSMGVTRRLQLLAWAQSTGAWIFEDDYDAEYRYVGRPLPALQGLDRAHCTVRRQLQQDTVSGVAAGIFRGSAGAD
ncbi:MAG: PLP-dependent aminotransferase family protein [Gemmatimonadaceae bacterium]